MDKETRSGGVEGTVACPRESFVELAPGSLPPNDMARACGLAMSFTPETCSECTEMDRFRQCWKELDRGTHGLVTRVVCEVCLPGFFERHIAEQARMDRIVEAEVAA